VRSSEFPTVRLAFDDPASDSCGGGERKFLKLHQVIASRPTLPQRLAVRPRVQAPATAQCRLALGYVRVVACPQIDPRRGLDTQIATIRAVAERDQIEIIQVFEDLGESAHNLKRPGLLALLAAVDAASANVIIVPDLARLARDNADLLRLMDSFNRQGVKLVSAVERPVREG
jgi:predicted site-specific integrase-resolvase